MAKIVFMSLPAYGHVNPTLPVVQELVKRGNRVIYYNTEEFRAPIERMGAEFRPYPPPMPTVEETKQIINQHLVRMTVFILDISQRLTGYMMDELRREQPDLVVHDSICLWGMQAARVLGLPSVSSITTFVMEGAEYLLPKRELLYTLAKAIPLLPRIVRLRRRLLNQYGQNTLPKVLFPTTGDLNLVFTSRAFQPETTFIDERFRFVGPAINPATREETFPFERLGRKPLVYISMGTIHNNNLDFYRQCFEAFSNHPGQFVLSAGKGTDLAALGEIPTNFIVQGSVPQLKILQQADLFITHGGMNSVQEGLYYGVPLVVIPQQMEQAMNAKVMEWKGAGVVLGGKPPYGHTTAAELRQAADRVLNDARYYEAARQVGASFREAGGYLRAADEIEAFAAGIRRATTSAA
jgi:MGT family glycosyltransferase